MATAVTTVDHLSTRYSKHPVIRSLLQLIPWWASADVLLQHRAEEIRLDRMRTFFDELADGKHRLTEEIILSEDFLHCYFCTLRAALNTRHREKIRLLARLLDKSISEEIGTTTDEYEELLSVLDAISLREFAVLRDLMNLEREHPLDQEGNALQNAWHYWSKFMNDSIGKHGISREAFNAFMAKLERTGLYLRITGSFLNYCGDIGRTTPLFERLIQFVSDNEVKGGSDQRS